MDLPPFLFIQHSLLTLDMVEAFLEHLPSNAAADSLGGAGW